MMERVFDKEGKRKRMFISSGCGFETESGKNLREAGQFEVEHIRTAMVGGRVREGRGQFGDSILHSVG